MVWLLGCLAVTNGCATILGPSKHEVRVESRPAGAKVWVNGYFDSTTPTVVKIPRGNEARIVVAYNGQRRDCAIAYRLSGGWLVADIIFGLLPLIVDAATGAWYEPGSRECFSYFDEQPTGPVRQRKSARSEPPSEFNEPEAVELCNKGVERYCRMLLDHEQQDLPEGDGVDPTMAPEERRQERPAQKPVFKPSGGTIN